jgi:hypothetical protein
MKNLCRNCKHWELNDYAIKLLPDYKIDMPEGCWYLTCKCKRLEYGIDITLHTGWDGGTVQKVETDANFGCVYFCERT